MKKRLKIIVILFLMSFSTASSAEERCLGLFLGDAATMTDLKQASELYNTKPCLMLLFFDATRFPDLALLNSIRDLGATPVLTFEPWIADSKKPAKMDKGYISKLAEVLNNYEGQVYVRFAHEMNGNWYPWAGDPSSYVAEYIAFHDGLQTAAPKANIKWIWSVNNIDVPDTPKNNALMYYPGENYVDVVGLDGYLKNPSFLERLYIRASEFFLKKGVFDHLFGKKLLELKKITKPVMITETAIASDDVFKADAIDSFFRDLNQNYPAISSFIWFDVNKEADWKIASGVKSLEHFRKGIKVWTSYEKTRIARPPYNGE